MADFKTGHAQPPGFVAGPVKDGASLGLFTIKSTNAVAPGGTVEVRVRSVSGKLVALLETKLASGSVSESSRIKQAQYLLNVANDWVTEKSNLLAIANLVATGSELSALSLGDNGQVSGTATGATLGYEQNIGGVLIKTTGTVTPNPDGITPITTPDNTPVTTTSKWKKWMTYVAVGVGVLIVAVVGYRVYKKA